METEKVIEVLKISLPVFAMMGLGKWLSVRKIMSEDHRDFINRITYAYALPSLIFVGLARQHFSQFWEPALLIGVVGAVGLITFLYVLLAFILRIKGGMAAAFIFGSFWANVSYMGFPLAANAFGQDKGFAQAAVVNAFTLPVFVILGFVLIGAYHNAAQSNFSKNIFKGVANPIVMAALLGMAFAFMRDFLFDFEQNAESLKWIGAIASLIASFLELLGRMGLPLALLSVGASLKIKSITGNVVPLSLTVAAKLVIVPLLTFGIIAAFFPHTDFTARATAVILMATPNAVASFVIAKQMHLAEEFVSALLVVSTAASIITIPAWLYFLL
jgi:predicted permease